MELRVDDVVDSSGAVSEYGVVIRNPYVIVLPFEGNELLLVRQYRYPIDAWTLELPQGAVEDGEAPFAAAARELGEEAGCSVHELKHIGRLYEAAGFATHHAEVFLGDVSHHRHVEGTGAEAGISARFYPWSELRRMIVDGRMVDAPTLAAISMAMIWEPHRFAT